MTKHKAYWRQSMSFTWKKNDFFEETANSESTTRYVIWPVKRIGQELFAMYMLK